MPRRSEPHCPLRQQPQERLVKRREQDGPLSRRTGPMIVSHWSSRSAFTIALWKVVFNSSDNPRCGTTAVSNQAVGTGVCHRGGLGAGSIGPYSVRSSSCVWTSSRAPASESSECALSTTRLMSSFTPSQAHFSSRQAGTRASPASAALAPFARAVCF